MIGRVEREVEEEGEENKKQKEKKRKEVLKNHETLASSDGKNFDNHVLGT